MFKQPLQTSTFVFIGSLICLSIGNQLTPQHLKKTTKLNIPESQPPSITSHDIKVKINPEVIEGQSSQLYIGILPQFAKPLQKKRLIISYQDTSYGGEELFLSQPILFKGSHFEKNLIFQSPGKKTLKIKDNQGNVLIQKEVKVTPFKASVFPKHWDKHKEYSQEHVADWNIWVNLYSESQQKNGQRQYLQTTFKNEIIDRFLVSSGAKGHPTPLGSFKLGFKEEYPRSRRYNNTPMPFWSAINVNGNEGEYGFHSLDNGNYLYLLGKPASHGCVRLSRLPSVEIDPKTGKKYWGDRGGARWLYDRVPKGTQVTIFEKKLAHFEFQDYQDYLLNKAKEYQSKKKKQS